MLLHMAEPPLAGLRTHRATQRTRRTAQRTGTTAAWVAAPRSCMTAKEQRARSAAPEVREMSLRSWRPSVTLVRFLTVGLVSYVVNQAALYALYDRLLRGFDATIATPFGSLGGRLLVASILAMEVSILVRFVLNDCSTF